MQQEKQYLWETGKVPYFCTEYGQEEPAITPFLLDNGRKNGCVIVCPGGGYACRMESYEGAEIAQWLNQNGISAVLLHYRVHPYQYPAMTEDVQRAVRYVRYRAGDWSIDPEKVGVIGFSAGGHLASTTAYCFDRGREDGDAVDRFSSRPDAVLLCYAVLTMGRYADRGTHDNFLKGLPEEHELERAFSAECAVREDAPPCFLFHTQDDSYVPVQNSLMMYETLTEKGVRSELHIFPCGDHGVGLGASVPGTCQWPTLAVDFLKRQGFVR